MYEQYWPWGKYGATRPRGFKNLNLQEIFSHEDNENARRLTGILNLCKPGCGAPMVSHFGKRCALIREDPILRFQWTKDLRKCVDNTLRYRTSKSEQKEYKRQLDKLVMEKKLNEKNQRKDKLDYEKNSGWSSEDTLKKLELEKTERNKNREISEYNTREPVIYAQNKSGTTNVHFVKNEAKFRPNNKKLAPVVDDNVNGVELVPLLARQRLAPLKIPLDTTDITRDTLEKNKWKTDGPAYLKQLIKQINQKNQRLKEIKEREDEIIRRHFTTVDSFWGRPGHGAPMSFTKKSRLNNLLFPQVTPINVH